MMAKVQIYTTPTCHFCKMAKEYFNEKNIAYEAYDVVSDAQKRQEMVEKSGSMAVPVIVIDDKVIVGFDKERVNKALGITN
ncbi:MAG: NrdH-redoxin [Candidatus Yanofskybacteria bacterium CG10_big_fil_rev_8_21_14_0_10_36_16]|uniref:NrdH-redoxin n=1 Tax=Candidatus Yanofskybacteria bacterium CG10_big_fil_rev_8_21_14_0_10_36_16 TaxID=1975096 RepID=A0A2J0QC67_9BACT|nr:MAG: NrdH-redoxin [Candidatus Yanofskybacteria bacterium CG10_big_fil_rev_8_21_14_0_10_36_16]